MPQVEGHIQRKSMLYKTGVEYGDYTLNFVQGCAHGCKYPCYAFLLKKRFGQIKTYEEWIKPYLVSNTLEILDKEIPRLKDKIMSVHLSFSTDPFMMGYPEIEKMSIAVIKKLNAAGIKCTVLTKGILPITLADFSKENEYGITLISLDEEYRKKMEPGSASYVERLVALKKLHDKGCKTWVSIEPYPTPNLIDQDLKKILKAVRFVDKIIFGRTNYCKDVTSGYPEHKKFYNERAKEVIDFCNEKGIAFHIKNKTITE
ncbi:radical SAM protein [Butyrivibrio hungatei]|uniref:radical SAM protein n=1 Tax=Butyrivibrio hungatei TaxID=185008 RepID=UPI0004088A3E|nr:radical SAM protein [Butyrivibrio hungatei]